MTIQELKDTITKLPLDAKVVVVKADEVEGYVQLGEGGYHTDVQYIPESKTLVIVAG